MASASDLRSLVAKGWLIGSHTKTHRKLPLLDDDAAIEEVEGSLAELNALDLNPAKVLAYPYGAHDSRIRSLIARAGIEMGFTTESGTVSSDTDPLVIPRIEILRGDIGERLNEKLGERRTNGSGASLTCRGLSAGTSADGLTVALLSCGRFDLLRLTIESLIRKSSQRIDEIIVTEDSGLPDAERRLDEVLRPFGILVTKFVHGERHGIFACMDEIYRRVNTPYVLHLEDDWVCTSSKSDFVQRSIKILKARPDILQVWLRAPQDCNGHPLEQDTHDVEGAKYRLLSTGFEGIWHGYSNNPNIRRISDYSLLGPGGYSELSGASSGDTEARVGDFYYRRGFRAAVLCEPDAGFVHVGVSRSIEGKMWWRSHTDLEHKFQVVCTRAAEMQKEIDQYRKAIATKKAPDLSDRIKTAQQAVNRKDYERADSDLREIAKSAAEVSALLGRIAVEKGRLKEALPFWESAVTFAPTVAHYRGRLAVVLTRLGQSEASQSVLRQLNEQFPSDLATWEAELDCARWHKDTQAVTKACQKLLEIEPNSIRALLVFGWAAADTGRTR